MNGFIETIRARGFKGQDFDHELDKPVTVFHGANGRGKSARLEAAKLALLGYADGDGKGAVRAPAQLHELYASRPTMAVEVSIRYSNDSRHLARRSWSKGKSVQYTGPEAPVVEAPMLDPDQFFSMSGPERTRYIFFASGAASSLDAAAVRDALASNLKGHIFENQSPEHEKAVREQLERVAPAGAGSVVEWLKELVDSAKEDKKLAVQNARRLEATVQGMVQSEGADEQPPDPAAQSRLDAAVKASWDAGQRKRQADAALTAARTAYSTAKAKLAPGDQEDMRKLEERAAIAEEAARDPATLSWLADSEEEARRLEAASESGTALVAELFVKRTDAERAVAVADAQRGRAASDLEKAEHAAHAATCPTCGQKMPKKAMAKAEENRAAATAALDAANAELARHRAKLERVSALESGARALAALDAHSEARQQLEALEKEGRELAASAASAAKAAQEAEDAVAPLQEAAAKLAAAKAARLAFKQAVGAAAEARAKADVASAFESIVSAAQEEAVARCMKRVLELAAGVCDVLPMKLGFDDGEITLEGRTRKSLSDSERIMLYCGLAVALAVEAPLRVALVGRLEALDENRQRQLVDALLKLVDQDRLDQAILVAVGDTKLGGDRVAAIRV